MIDAHGWAVLIVSHGNGAVRNADWALSYGRVGRTAAQWPGATPPSSVVATGNGADETLETGTLLDGIRLGPQGTPIML